MKKALTTVNRGGNPNMDEGKKLLMNVALVTAGLLGEKMIDLIGATNRGFDMQIAEWKDTGIPKVLEQPTYRDMTLTKGPRLLDAKRVEFILSSGGTDHQFICNTGNTCKVVATTIASSVIKL